MDLVLHILLDIRNYLLCGTDSHGRGEETMLLGQRCTTCRESITATETVECETCGDRLHTACERFETSYMCPKCGDEPWIGAVEF